MNANDLRLYQSVEEYCDKLQLQISLTGDDFTLVVLGGMCLGRFPDINSVSQYIYGYEAGFSRGKCQCK